jgi:hypothetical protein
MADVPPLEELYEHEELEAIEAWARRRVQDPDRAVPGDTPTAEVIDPAGRRDPRSLGTGGAILAAALFGVADALEPDKVREEIVEERPEAAGGPEQAVTFLYVPGDPQASRLVIRPWLLED